LGLSDRQYNLFVVHICLQISLYCTDLMLLFLGSVNYRELLFFTAEGRTTSARTVIALRLCWIPAL